MAKFARSARNRRGSMPQQEQGAGGTPALPGDHSPLEGESRKPSRREKADAVGWWRQAGESIFFIINMDAQDAQDSQDETLVQQEPARAMIRFGLADALD